MIIYEAINKISVMVINNERLTCHIRCNSILLLTTPIIDLQQSTLMETFKTPIIIILNYDGN